MSKSNRAQDPRRLRADRQGAGVPSGPGPAGSDLGKRAVVAEIRRLHRQGAPLNISAVERRWPHLLAAALRPKRYWGWRQALRDAGLDYGRIHVEVLDTVTCQLCDHEYRALPNHLRAAHGAEVSDYRAEFPGAPLLSESLRAQMTRGRQLLPHWEPLWSGPYILDRIVELHRRRLPLHVLSMGAAEPATLAAAHRYVGDWDVALARAGLDPSQIRRRPSSLHWTEEEVLRQLTARRQAGLPVYPSTLPGALYAAVRARFGSFDRAMERLGVEPLQARRRHPRYTPELVDALLADVARAVALPDSERASECNRLRRRYGRLPSQLGGWGALAAAAGAPPESLRRTTGPVSRYPDRRAILAEIRRRRREGLSLRSLAVQRGRGRPVGSERIVQDRALFKRAEREFGSWAAALAAAGVRLTRP